MPVDVFATGVLFYRLLKNDYPVIFTENQELIYKCKKKDLTKDNNSGLMVKALAELIMDMIHQDPNLRPSIKEVIYNGVFL